MCPHKSISLTSDSKCTPDFSLICIFFLSILSTRNNSGLSGFVHTYIAVCIQTHTQTLLAEVIRTLNTKCRRQDFLLKKCEDLIAMHLGLSQQSILSMALNAGGGGRGEIPAPLIQKHLLSRSLCNGLSTQPSMHSDSNRQMDKSIQMVPLSKSKSLPFS